MSAVLFTPSSVLPIYKLKDGIPYPLDVPYIEGSETEIKLTRYERDDNARRKCLEHYGYTCKICGFNFEQTYGEIGKGYIHVHHIIPMSEIGHEYTIDPINDLIPVCPNCHAMLHRAISGEVVNLETLRALFIRTSKAEGGSCR